MAQRVQDFLSRLGDPNEFVEEPDVPIFDEHDEPYWCLPDGRTEDDDGKPVTRRTPGAERRVKQFTPDFLHKIADACNQEDALGNYSPLSIGHINPDEEEETKLPPQVGYAKGYRVEYDPDLRKHVILTNFYFHAGDYEKAKEYGSISIELWPGSWNVWPIALLKRAPQRSLPRWHYHRGAPKLRATHPLRFARHPNRPSVSLRYTMRDTAMSANRYSAEDATDVDAPDTYADDGLDAPAGDLSHAEKAEQFMKHCFSHPHAAHFAKHYAMEDAPEGDLPDPTDPPDADADPLQHSAFPSATDTGLPGGGKDKAKPFAKGGKAPVRTVKQDAAAILYARQQREIDELKAEAAANRAKAAESDARRRVTQLVHEGFDVPDVDAEVLRYSRMPEGDRDAHESYFRSFARQAPVGRTGRVQLAETPRPGDAPPLGDITREHSQRAMQYMKTHRLSSDQWDEAVEKTRK